MFKWGIIGLGRIANKFASELLETGLGIIGAAGSRDINKAALFTQQYGGEAFGSYDDFISNARIDAVYIAVPHHLHAELTLKCLKKGIPVLCEKPFTINAGELQTIVDFQQKNKVFLMEAMWSRFMPHIEWIKSEFDNNSFGKLLHLKAEFCFKGKERGVSQGVSRLIRNELGGGALLDIGIYPVFLSHLFFGSPDQIHAHAKIENDIDETCQMIFTYKDGSTAFLDSSILWETDGRAEFYFEHATIIIPKKWHESNELQIKKNGSELEIKTWKYPSRGFYFEMKEVQECLAVGKTNSDKMTLEFSMEVMKTLDKVRNKIGLQYPADIAL